MKLRNFAVLAALMLFLSSPAFGSRTHKDPRVRQYHHVKYHGHHIQHHGRAHHKL